MKEEFKQRQMLTAFVNITPDDQEAYRSFENRYGPIFHGAASADYFQQAANFRQAWTAKEPHERQQVSRNLGKIFNEQFPLGWDSPGKDVIEVNFGDEHFPISIRPRSLLDKLVLILLTSEYLNICANPECPQEKYFVGATHKQKYCSYNCANAARKQTKRNWWDEHGNDWRNSKTKKGRKTR